MFLQAGARSEVSSPILVSLRIVGEEVLVVNGPRNVLFFDGIEVLRWSGVNEGEVALLVLVADVDQQVDFLERLVPVHVRKVITEEHQHVLLTCVPLRRVLNVIDHMMRFLTRIEVLYIFQILYWRVVIRPFVVLESFFRGSIAVSKYVRIYLLCIAEML